MALTQVTAGILDNSTQTYGMKNRIINGDMRIAQRGTGATAIDNGNWYYAVDRFSAYQSIASSKFSVQQNYNSVTPPAGFKNYFGAYTTTAYTPTGGDWFPMRHTIEGYNVADLEFGTANAKSVTASFWVRSSITGTHGGAFYNNDGSRSYPFTYAISSANTWEYKTITIPGDTSGTWNTTNGGGLTMAFSMGTGTTNSGPAGSWASAFYASATGVVSPVSTLGATWFITGLQIEKGSAATQFDYRPYGTELALCQRYCYVIRGSDSYYGRYMMTGTAAGSSLWMPQFPVQMRAIPSFSTLSITNATVEGYNYNSGGALGNVTNFSAAENTLTSGQINVSFATGVSAGAIVSWRFIGTPTAAVITFNSEL
jgi:hypothetical protein